APVPVQGVLLLLYAAAQSLLGASVLVGALRTQMAHQQVTRFLTRMNQRTEGGGALRDALAEALEDPSLTLHYRRADSGEYVDAHGMPAPLPTGPSRAVTWVTGSAGQPLAALVHDPFLTQQPQHRRRLDAVVTAASLALENARLNAENRAHLRGILDIELATRHRIRSMLHDGPQHRLSGIQLLVGQLRRSHGDEGAEPVLQQIAQELQAAVQDLRDVTEGIYPAILRTKGLEDALDSLAQRSPIPLVLDIASGRWPEYLEETVFMVISEAVGNAHKHAHATSITVTVHDDRGRLVAEIRDDGDGGAASNAHGSGLRGMRDRVAAHEGTLHIDSPPGGGTTVRAVLPCV
ncbi:MAG TPA: sensor histidine kinase, partial [Micromonosporaceae bacterium]|nr:sensor histidine kinase [Micromonosporaceae bacterium]